MSAERPTIERGNLQGSLRAIPETFKKVIDDVKPDGLDWQRIEAAMDVLTGEKIAVTPKPPEPEPTESQKFWQKMFENGDQPLYSKDKGPIKFDALKKAVETAMSDPIDFVKHGGEHIRAIDTDFRGGRDAGDIKERAQRVGVLLGITGVFTAFDYATSKPFKKIFPVLKDDQLHGVDEMQKNMRNSTVMKLIDVMNDKYATALGNMLAQKLTGKRGFIHEVADKGADTIQVGYPITNDLINGATLESYMRIAAQFPVFGALIEQGFTRLSMLQEKSPLHTATGKMAYMALGVFIRENRKIGKMKADELISAVARGIE